MVPDMLIVISLMLGSTLAWTPPASVLNIPQEVDLVKRIQADNDNCNVYYYLKVPMTCGEGNAFNKATLRCDSVETVGKVDPGCGGGYGGSSRVSGRNGGNRQRGTMGEQSDRVGTVLAFSVFFGFRVLELFIRVSGRVFGPGLLWEKS